MKLLSNKINALFTTEKALVKISVLWIILILGLSLIYKSNPNLGFDLAESKRYVVLDQDISQIESNLHNITGDIKISSAKNSEDKSVKYIQLDNNKEEVDKVRKILDDAKISFSVERVNSTFLLDINDAAKFIGALSLLSLITLVAMFFRKTDGKYILALFLTNLHTLLLTNLVIISFFVALSKYGWQINDLTIIALVCINLLAALIPLVIQSNIYSANILENKLPAQAVSEELNTKIIGMFVFSIVAGIILAVLAFAYDLRVEAYAILKSISFIVITTIFLSPLYLKLFQELGKSSKKSPQKKK